MTQTDTGISKLNRMRDEIQNFPLKCRLYLNMLLSDVLPAHQFQIPKTFKKNFESFLHIFKKFSSEEKTYLICQLSRHVQGFLNGTRNLADNMINQIETSCQMKLLTLGFSFWQRRNFKYCAQQHLIKLFTSKKQDVLDLKKYLIRKSNSQKNSLVFESVSNDVSHKFIKVTLKFSNLSIMSEIFSNIRNAMISVEQKKLQKLISQDLKERNIQNMNESNKRNKGFTILTKKIMTQYFNSKEKDLEKISFHRTQANIIYNRNQVRIFRSKQNKKYFFLQQNLFSDSISALKQKIMFLNESIKQKTYSCQVLESFNQNITANYYKMEVNKQEYQFIVIIQKNQKEDSFSQIIKGINNFSMGISIQFGIVTLRKVGNSSYVLQLNVLLDFHSSKKNNRSLKAVNLLRQLVKENWKNQLQPINNTICIDCRPRKQSLNEKSQCDKSLTKNLEYSLKEANMFGNEQNFGGTSGSKSVSIQSFQKDNQDFYQQELFVTISNFDDDQEITIHYFQETLIKNCQEDSIYSTSHSNKNDLLLQKQKSYLNVKSQMQPLKNCSLKQLKSHFLFGDWQRSSKGGVILVNEQVNNVQKKIFRLLLARLGNSILSGNGIMNVSLPVQMFKDESQLVSIARNFTYTPYIIEPSVNLSPLQKIKKVMLFQISIEALSLSTQKPFNPILGQTYQGDINGCPIYLQQISHHPPVSYFYMVGRGYKIYGSHCVDVHLRLNHIKGITHNPIFVEYDNGDKIEFTLPIMIVNGLLIGERSLYFEGTIYFIDKKNLLIGCMTYNCNSKKGLFSFKSESPDFLSAQIYQVSQNFMKKFIASNKTIHPKKEQTNKVLATISGEWNGKIYINDKIDFNFQVDLPVELENFNYPLLSDSTFRSDVQLLKKGDMSHSQQEKDRLQINQRRDKKLRQSHKAPKEKK